MKLFQLPSPWAPTEMTSSTKTHQCLPHNSAVNLINCKGFTDEIAAVRNCLLKGEIMIITTAGSSLTNITSFIYNAPHVWAYFPYHLPFLM